jgi:predicted dehydrogenase
VTKPLKVALVGAGLIGHRRARLLREAGDVLCAVADVDHARAQALAKETNARVTSSWEEAVSADVDAVVVAVPNALAAPVCIAAAGNGKHVLCEKPLGRNLGEATAIAGAAVKAGVTLKTGFNHRHHRAILAAHKMMTAGDIGDPFCLRCVYGHGGRRGYEREWRGNADLAGGGELLDQGVHLVDLARWFLGEFSEVQGLTARWIWDIAPLEDNAFAWMRTTKGRVATFHTSWTEWKNRFSFELFGSDGYVFVHGLGGSYGPERLVLGRRNPTSGPPMESVIEFTAEDNSWQSEWEEFRSAIAQHREPLGNGTDGREALRLIDAIYEAARAGTLVRISSHHSQRPV